MSFIFNVEYNIVIYRVCQVELETFGKTGQNNIYTPNTLIHKHIHLQG